MSLLSEFMKREVICDSISVNEVVIYKSSTYHKHVNVAFDYGNCCVFATISQYSSGEYIVMVSCHSKVNVETHLSVMSDDQQCDILEKFMTESPLSDISEGSSRELINLITPLIDLVS